MTKMFGDSSKYDADQIREMAKTHAERGAVTSDYPLDVRQACRLLNDALATEIVCVLRYRHHQIVATGLNAIPVAEEFEEHAEKESEHMMWIAERIHQLGGDPELNPGAASVRSIAEYGVSTDLAGMIREDLIAERVVISLYRKLIQWFGQEDPTTRRLLEHILSDEEEHATDLANLLEEGAESRVA